MKMFSIKREMKICQRKKTNAPIAELPPIVNPRKAHNNSIQRKTDNEKQIKIR